MNRLEEYTRGLPENPEPPRMLAIASGKGGVGKSVVALNLADRLAENARVLLIDGDFQTANLHLLINIVPQSSWQDVCYGRVGLGEAIIKINSNLHFLASAGISHDEGIPDIKSLARFLSDLRRQLDNYDFLIFDTASGILPHTTLILHSVDEIILVVTPELTAISDGYALYKTLVNNNKQTSISLLINREDISDETEYIHNKFTAITSQFLNHTPALLGSLGYDKSLVEAIANQKLVSEYAPESRINSQFADQARKISGAGKTASFTLDEINTNALRADTKE